MFVKIGNHEIARQYAMDNVGSMLGLYVSPAINPYQTSVTYDCITDDEYGDSFHMLLIDETNGGRGVEYFVPNDYDLVKFAVHYDNDTAWWFMLRFTYDEHTHKIEYRVEPIGEKPDKEDGEKFNQYVSMSMWMFSALKSYEQQVITW